MAGTAHSKGDAGVKAAAPRVWLPLWLAGAFGILGLLSPVACVLALFGLLPTIVAGVCDRHPHRYTTITVGAFNVAGLLPWLPLFLATGGREIPAAFREGVPIIVMYGAAAAGWVVYVGLPAIFEAVRVTFLARERERLARMQDTLRDTWGDGVGAAAGPLQPGGGAVERDDIEAG